MDGGEERRGSLEHGLEIRCSWSDKALWVARWQIGLLEGGELGVAAGEEACRNSSWSRRRRLKKKKLLQLQNISSTEIV
jgi:hypothetical protein